MPERVRNTPEQRTVIVPAVQQRQLSESGSMPQTMPESALVPTLLAASPAFPTEQRAFLESQIPQDIQSAAKRIIAAHYPTDPGLQGMEAYNMATFDDLRREAEQRRLFQDPEYRRQQVEKAKQFYQEAGIDELLQELRSIDSRLQLGHWKDSRIENHPCESIYTTKVGNSPTGDYFHIPGWAAGVVWDFQHEYVRNDYSKGQTTFKYIKVFVADDGGIFIPNAHKWYVDPISLNEWRRNKKAIEEAVAYAYRHPKEGVINDPPVLRVPDSLSPEDWERYHESTKDSG